MRESTGKRKNKVRVLNLEELRNFFYRFKKKQKFILAFTTANWHFRGQMYQDYLNILLTKGLFDTLK